MANSSHYILSKRIARGGMAEIYLAKAVGEDGFQRICAVKRILPHYSQDKEFVEMFRDEAHICKRLQHGNIVQVFDFKEVEGSYALIMEFVDGSDLRSVLAACEAAKVRLSVPMVVYLIAESARGLHYAHTKVDEVTGKPLEIVHRDISPQNILVSFEGEIKITDFGIADADSSHKSNETRPGIVKGKYSYMSPEQVAAKSLDARSDVFSLCIVLWEALAMRRLFSADSDVQIIKKVQECDISHHLPDLNKDVDEELYTLVMRGLNKDRKKRQQTAGALEKELRKYLHTKYPDFTPSEVAGFLKQLLKAKREESSQEIKRTLTSEVPAALPTSTPAAMSIADNNNTPPDSSARDIAQQTPASGWREINLTLDEKDNAPLAMAKTNLRNGSGGSMMTAKPSNHGTGLNAPGMATTGTNANGLYTGYNTGIQRYRMRQGRKSNKSLWTIVATLVLTLAGVAMFAQQHFSARDGQPAKITIQSFPERVRIKVDGKDLARGSYVNTPRHFDISPGSHTIQISRENYLPETVTTSIEPGETTRLDKIILKEDPSVRFAPTRIQSNKRVYFSINRGYITGTTPAALNDLAYGITHTITAYPNYPKNTDSFACNFVPRASSTKVPYIVQLDAGKPGSPSQCKLMSPEK